MLPLSYTSIVGGYLNGSLRSLGIRRPMGCLNPSNLKKTRHFCRLSESLSGKQLWSVNFWTLLISYKYAPIQKPFGVVIAIGARFILVYHKPWEVRNNPSKICLKVWTDFEHLDLSYLKSVFKSDVKATAAASKGKKERKISMMIHPKWMSKKHLELVSNLSWG